jgi:hypothetical protein
MTNEEAINVLNDYDINFERHTAEEIAEAHEMAIEAIRTIPSEDCISRKAVLDALHSYFAEGFNEDRWWNSTYVLNAINKVPSIVPQPKTEGARDEKVGHWEWVQYDANPNIGNWHCSECSCILRGETNKGPVRLPKYCPDCGAKMEVDK